MSRIYDLDLSNYHIKKIDSAFRRKSDVSIQLKNNQLSGKHKLQLSDRQINNIEKSKRNKTGIRLKLKYSQLRENHAGGFIQAIIAALPWITAMGAAVSTASSITNTILNKKSETQKLEEQKRHNKVLEGKGLKKTKK